MISGERTARSFSLFMNTNFLGWTGSIPYLLAYALVSAKKTEGDSLLYKSINSLAGAYATTGLNAVWVIIGLLTLGQKWLIRN
jgi:hypothetical protein